MPRIYDHHLSISIYATTLRNQSILLRVLLLTTGDEQGDIKELQKVIENLTNLMNENLVNTQNLSSSKICDNFAVLACLLECIEHWTLQCFFSRSNYRENLFSLLIQLTNTFGWENVIICKKKCEAQLRGMAALYNLLNGRCQTKKRESES